MNQNIPRLEKAFRLLEQKNVVLMNYPTGIVWSLDGKRKHKVNYMNQTCDCEDMAYNGVERCQHVFACQIKAGMYGPLEKIKK